LEGITYGNSIFVTVGRGEDGKQRGRKKKEGQNDE
jgi:hypothetical protein